MYLEESNLGLVDKMTDIDKRDARILLFLKFNRETFFQELVNREYMAKSTLCKHLKALREKGLVKKFVSKKRKLGDHDVVYAPTTEGLKTLANFREKNNLPAV
jgi:DNA-binding MarR family transcriptional regulator